MSFRFSGGIRLLIPALPSMFSARARFVIPRLLCVWALLCPAMAGEPPPLIRRAMEFRFMAEPGKVYELQGTADGSAWARAAGPFFGNGAAIEGFFPTDAESGGVRYRDYRVKELDPSAFGPAPSTLADTTVVLNDSGRPREVIFLDEGRGLLKTDSEHMRTFSYTLKRESGRALGLALTYFDDTQATLRLDFSSARVGGYQFADAASGDEDRGGFGLHPRRLRSREPTGNRPNALPTQLAGKDLVFSQGGEVTLLHFLSDSMVTLTLPDGSVRIRPYSYDPASPLEATLDIIMEDGGSLHADMSMSSETSGTFEWQAFDADGNPSGDGGSSEGDFNSSDDPDPSANPDCPPKDLDGESLFLSGSESMTLNFNADGTGTAVRDVNGSVEVTPFTYDYQRSGNGGAGLAITFPGAADDTVEDYDFDYGDNCTGTYRRNDYNGGELTGGGQGNFGPGGAAGRPAPSGLVMGLVW